jgi:hypothetical protein
MPMKNIFKLCLALSFLMAASMTQAQSLGDLAKKEKQRRDGIQNDKVITAEEAAKFKSEPGANPAALNPSPDPKTEAEAEQEANSADQPSKADPDESVDFKGRTESYWRKTMAEARKKVTDLENEANALALKLNDLQARLTGTGLDGAGDNFKKESIQREMQKGYYEQDLNKERLAKAKTELQDLENDAQKNGALPGWVENPKR